MNTADSFFTILWMDEILLHLRNPAMIDPLVNTEQNMVSHGFKAVQDFVHPQYGISCGEVMIPH